jgi:hypothetical protein
MSIRVSSSPSLGDGTGGEQDKQSVWVAHGHDRYRSAWSRLSDAPGGATEAETGKPAKRSFDIDEERQR